MQWWLSFIRVFVKLRSIRLFRPASGLSSLMISRGTHVSAITLRTLRHFLMSFTAPSNASSSGTPMMRLHPQPWFSSSMSCCCWVTPARSSSHSWRIFATSALSSAFLVRIVRISSRMSCRLSSTSPLPRPRRLLMPPQHCQVVSLSPGQPHYSFRYMGGSHQDSFHVAWRHLLDIFWRQLVTLVTLPARKSPVFFAARFDR